MPRDGVILLSEASKVALEAFARKRSRSAE